YLYFSNPNIRTWSIQPGTIVDGTSNTVMFWERRVNTNGVMAFSPDGRWITPGGYDGGVRLWEPITGNSSRTNYFGLYSYLRPPLGLINTELGVDPDLLTIYDVKRSEEISGRGPIDPKDPNLAWDDLERRIARLTTAEAKRRYETDLALSRKGTVSKDQLEASFATWQRYA